MFSVRGIRVVAWLAIFAVAFCSACRSSSQPEEGVVSPRSDEGIVVINAPVAGVVRRVLVNEGVAVGKDAEVIEIAVSSPAASPTEDPQALTRTAAQNAQREITLAQSEAERAAVEVQRIEPLVAAGVVPQAQLDAARAQNQRAQERLQFARDRAKSAQANLTLQAGGSMPAATAAPTPRVVLVRAPTNGIVRVISVRAGQQVTAGQPLATVSASKE